MNSAAPLGALRADAPAWTVATQAGETLRARAALAQSILRPTPIVPLHSPEWDLHVKLEGGSAFGSVKDRPALWILRKAIERGDIDPDTQVVESSSGNFACALAGFCRFLSLRFTAVVDPNVSPLCEAALKAYSASVIKVTERDETGGFLKTRLATVHQLRASSDSVFWPNQYANPDGMAAHYESTAQEILSDLPGVDIVFLGVSSAGTIAGVSRRLKSCRPGIRIVAVDAEGSVIFGGKPSPRRLPGLGSSMRPPLLDEALIDDVVVVPEQEAIAGCRELLVRHGVFAGASTGACYAAIRRHLCRSRSLARPKVLFLGADRGAAYVESVFGCAGSASPTDGPWHPAICPGHD